ncbi:ATP-dependent DNA helicase RecG [Sulfurimonas autotrophica]|uniref:ATP-dependent DNA helicase RecG n=1 Tax=Sulfurimonas autotrophica (strain ATCC BAA-671 / DSM 16294 / JCM 11897 / OK10) TaxID=563040 RepID=E0UQA4_SULAO|nr:ATP-dependent DNA helicase RecG [Sulfurimonas autotrophica]ADN09847.1 ATP-dependent DNA helicase RecG [Sulfurimonas autotrophica DSM 16294]
MDLSKDAATKFNKLGINSLIELSLLIPHSYEDYRLHDVLLPQKAQLIDATVESIYKAPNSIQITFFAHNLGYSVQGVLFRPKPYMLHQFQVGARDYYYGIVDCKQGHCSMSMPKKITQVGKITPKYKTALRSDVMQRLVKSLVKRENLLHVKLKEDVVAELLKLHFPSDEFLQLKEMSEKTLWALKYAELFSYMQMLAGKRRYFNALSSKAGDYKAWSKSLPFTLTNEQINAIEDIRQDMQKDVAAKRMVVGDVGSGKTMVILAAAYMNMPNHSVLMAPTTILANQLFEEAQKYLPQLKVLLVTNKTKKIDLCEYDFIIGTHALLYRKLPQASLIMVDEQHRFGTAQRNMLEKMVAVQELKPHFIQFSATPIPRTQAMIESAHIDVSLITTTPFAKDIDSKVIHKSDFKDLLLHVKAEIAKNNQVLLVYPLVEQSEVLEYQSIEEARSYWEKNFENVYVTHGKDKEKEQVLLDFREKGDILIATTVVEVGISLPRLSTVVIVGAERLGLSTLHQLRGRVSRTGLKGYCFLYTNKNASERLDEFIHTKSGFDIANLDLKFRKSGDLLKGISQSGSQFRWIDFTDDENIVNEVKKDLGF